MSKFDAVMLKARLISDRAYEYLSVNTDSVPISTGLIKDMVDTIRDLRGLRYPEMQQLEPIGFGPSDEDRVKDMFEKVFLLEYGHSGLHEDHSLDGALNLATEAAASSADCYRIWLKEQVFK